MDPAVIGVFIPIIAITFGMGLGAIGMWSQHKQKMIKFELQREEARASASAGAAGHNAQRIEELEERLRVVERIVTDRGFDVAHQIEALRDERRLDEAARGIEAPVRHG